MDGYWWSGTAGSAATYGRYLDTLTGYVRAQYNSWRGYGFALRCGLLFLSSICFFRGVVLGTEIRITTEKIKLVLGAGERDIEKAVLVGFFGCKTIAENWKNRCVGVLGEDLATIKL